MLLYRKNQHTVKIIMDSDALIKLTRVKAKETILRAMEVYIPPKVFEETVGVPKKERYSDALLIEDNIKNGMLKVKELEASRRELSKERAKEYMSALKEMVSDEEYYVASKEVDE